MQRLLSGGDVWGAIHAVREEKRPANWLRIDSYDKASGHIKASFAATFVRCFTDAATQPYIPTGGESLVFTNGKISATVMK